MAMCFKNNAGKHIVLKEYKLSLHIKYVLSKVRALKEYYWGHYYTKKHIWTASLICITYQDIFW